jgi:hypothetical protein
MTSDQEYDLAVDTLTTMTIPQSKKIIDTATELSIKARLPFRDGLVLVMKLGQYFATHAGVKKNV